jgi:hypothetical protein
MPTGHPWGIDIVCVRGRSARPRFTDYFAADAGEVDHANSPSFTAIEERSNEREAAELLGIPFPVR